MSSESVNVNSPDPGLLALVMLLRFHGVGADPEQIRHRFGASTIRIPEMLRCARELGLKAQSRASSWKRLASTPLPAIIGLRDFGFLLLAKIGDDKALVQSPLSPRPAIMTREEFEAAWNGQVVLMTRRAIPPKNHFYAARKRGEVLLCRYWSLVQAFRFPVGNNPLWALCAFD